MPFALLQAASCKPQAASCGTCTKGAELIRAFSLRAVISSTGQGFWQLPPVSLLQIINGNGTEMASARCHGWI